MLSGKQRGGLKSELKTRQVDMKLGKKGMTENFIKEAKYCLNSNGVIKISLSSDKTNRIEQAKTISCLLGAELISIVGKTASFFLIKDE